MENGGDGRGDRIRLERIRFVRVISQVCLDVSQRAAYLRGTGVSVERNVHVGPDTGRFREVVDGGSDVR